MRREKILKVVVAASLAASMFYLVAVFVDFLGHYGTMAQEAFFYFSGK